MFKPTEAATPEEYIEAIDEPRRGDIRALHELIRETAPELEPRISSGMLAYGSYHYRYASGREGDWHPVALASQKRYISLYVIGTRDGGYLAETFRDRLPKADIGKSCVRFKRLSDVDTSALRELIREGARTREMSPG
jgi:uncharacterized protein YdhG (YjbR/CyaY superfamily)